MAQISPEEAGGRNVCAFLDMLAWSEGTDVPTQPTRNHGYDVIVGGALFDDYSKHPNRLVALPRLGISSTAAGRYQLLYRYWQAYSKSLRLTGFSPLVQDKIALQQIREQRALPLLQAGDLAGAIVSCRNIWASLPGAGYGQHEHKFDTLRAAYLLAGGDHVNARA